MLCAQSCYAVSVTAAVTHLWCRYATCQQLDEVTRLDDNIGVPCLRQQQRRHHATAMSSRMQERHGGGAAAGCGQGLGQREARNTRHAVHEACPARAPKQLSSGICYLSCCAVLMLPHWCDAASAGWWTHREGWRSLIRAVRLTQPWLLLLGQKLCAQPVTPRHALSCCCCRAPCVLS